MGKLSLREISLGSALAAFSAVAQLIHLGYQFPQWGMWIDVVAVSWLMAFFLFGFSSAFFVSLTGAAVITFFAPETWLGASMKWLATFPMWGSLYLFLLFGKKPLPSFQEKKNLFLPLILGLFLRCLVMLPLNYFYAIPLWTGMNTRQALQVIPWYIISLFNVFQGILETILAWLLVFKFRFSRFANWYEETAKK